MPFYEYQCQACGHHLEKLQKVSDPVLVDCPNCHKPQLQKLISATTFQLKGTGWYATDFKSPTKPSASGKDSDASGKTSSGSGDSTQKESSKDSDTTKKNNSSSPNASEKTTAKSDTTSTTSA